MGFAKWIVGTNKKDKVHQAKKEDIPINVPVPNPDQIVIEHKGEATIREPIARQEKNLIDKY